MNDVQILIYKTYTGGGSDCFVFPGILSGEIDVVDRNIWLSGVFEELFSCTKTLAGWPIMTTASPIASPVASFVESLRSPQILFPNLMAAALLAIMNVTTAISVAAPVFSGVLAPYLSTGIGLFLVGTAAGGALVAAGSGFKGVVAGPRSWPGAAHGNNASGNPHLRVAGFPVFRHGEPIAGGYPSPPR